MKSAPKKPPRNRNSFIPIPINDSIQKIIDSDENLKQISSPKSSNPFDDDYEDDIIEGYKSLNTNIKMNDNNNNDDNNDNNADQQENIELTNIVVLDTIKNNKVINKNKLSNQFNIVKNHINSFNKSLPPNKLYHKTTISDGWLIVTIFIHIGQWGILLNISFHEMPVLILIFILFLSLFIVALLIYGRLQCTKKKEVSIKNTLNYKIHSSPEAEQDNIPNKAIISIALASILEGLCFALFSSIMSGKIASEFTYISGNNNQDSTYLTGLLLETLRFTSITLLSFHRILRPSNRADPLRTMLELEVVSVCWDALDGSALFQLLDGKVNISPNLQIAARSLMAFWYISVGWRIAVMHCAHLSPDNKIYKFILSPPLYLAPQPIIDRTLQSLRLRSIVVLCMVAAEIFAVVIRLILFFNDSLDSLQQEMMIKNFVFFTSTYTAYDMWTSAIVRGWNTRSLPLGLKWPIREKQIIYIRWLFVISYLSIGCILSSILVEVSPDREKWIFNIGTDLFFSIFFIIYCKNAHVCSTNAVYSYLPKKEFAMFPRGLGAFTGLLMSISLFSARVPVLYYNYDNFDKEGVNWSYSDAMFCLTMSIIPIALFGMYWSISYMVFRKEFTCSPGNYNAIHDPTITMVVISTNTEGVTDVISCAALMSLASNSFTNVSLLELLNACQSFAIQTPLSGGHNATPLDLVRWKAYIRAVRITIDLFALMLRTYLWLNYGAVNSVFLIKNLYNLLHTISQIERYYGMQGYPTGTLFTELVNPADWYGLTKEQWRVATSSTIAQQARAGRMI